MVFSNARNGWMATSPQAGANGWTGGIWRTTDGGATWSEVWRGYPVRLDRIGLLPGGVGLYAAGVRLTGHSPFLSPVWLTSTAGSAWTAVAPTLPGGSAQPGNPPWLSMRFDFVSATTGFATGDPAETSGGATPMWETTDAGRVWRALALPFGFQATGGLDFTSAADGWITGGAKGTCDQIWRTTDGGGHWTPVFGTCPPYTLYALDFAAGGHGFAAGGRLSLASPVLNQAGILETSDGGREWQSVYHSGGQAAAPVTGLSFSSPTQGWAWGSTCLPGAQGPCPGTVIVSANGGTTRDRPDCLRSERMGQRGLRAGAGTHAGRRPPVDRASHDPAAAHRESGWRCGGAGLQWPLDRDPGRHFLLR